MNLFSKTGTKRLSKRVLAVLLAVVLIATQFLTTAMWSFADTASPSGKHYNVVLDADGLDKEGVCNPADAVTKVTDHARFGNAYAWDMSKSGDLTLNFPADGYNDESALVFWVDTTALSANTDVIIRMSDGTNTVTVSPDASEALVFTLIEGSEEMTTPVVNVSGAVSIAPGFAGWYLLPFEAFDGVLGSGKATSVSFSTSSADTLYLDEIGFAIGDWGVDFPTAVMENTLSANRRTTCVAFGHDMADATCTAPKTCSVCGITEGEALGHDWDVKNCAVDRTCLRCGTPEAAKEHTYTGGSCTVAGTCSACGAIQPAGEVDHDWMDATCVAPETCRDCGETRGEALGHNWKLGVCETCSAGVYDIAEDFADASVTGTAGAWELVSGDAYPFGQALKFSRGASSANITITFDEKGKATQKAIVFYYDNTGSGFTEDAAFSFVPTTEAGNQMCLGTGYTYYAVINGVVSERNPSNNFTLKLPKNTSGWVVLPLPGASGTVWHKSGSGTFYGTTQNVKQVYLEFIHFANASIVVDQFGFANDVELFKALAAAGNMNLPGYTGENVPCTGEHVWQDANCSSPKICSVCGLADGLTDPTKHNWVDPTCGKAGYCDDCGIDNPEAPATEQHDWVDPTCDKAGYCSVCGTENPNAPATNNHNWQEANCGYPKTCKDCGTTEGTPVGEHDWQEANCGYPKTCKKCGNTEGDPTGDPHTFVSGICTVCGRGVFDIAEDFTDASVSGTDGAWELVSGKAPFGQALLFGRETSKTDIKIALDKAGAAAHKAIIFYYDNTVSGNDGEAYFSFIPYYSGGCGLTLGTAYTYYVVTDGQVKTLNPSSNFSLKLPSKTSGWVILPLPASGTWSYGGGDGNIHSGTVEEIASVYLAFPEYHNAAVLIDQIGFAEDVDTFKTAALAGNKTLPGYVDICANGHNWVPANCGYPKTCSACGETEGDPVGEHNWVPATCAEDEYCSVCGKAGDDKATGNHNWDKEAPNCGYPKICQHCGATEGTPTGEHNKIPGSCTAQEYCDKCGMTFGEVPTGHKWGADNKCEVCGNYPANISAEDFESYGNGTNYTNVPCASPFGSSVKVTAGKEWTNLAFGTTGAAGAEALYFWYDASDASDNVKLQFIPRYEGGCGITIKGVNKDEHGNIVSYGHPVTSIINGVKMENNNTLFSENFTMTLTKGTSGWIIIPIDDKTTDVSTLWSYGGGDNVYSGTTLGLASVDVKITAGGSIVLDQFGFAEIAAGFVAKAEAGNENMDGYTGVQHNWVPGYCAAPKTCSGCGKTEGERVGKHDWKDGACTKCGQSIYTIAENFDDISVTGSKNELEDKTTVDSWKTVTNKTPFGQALWFGRTEKKANITITLDKKGTADQKAIVFYYDNTESGNSQQAYFYLRPYTSKGVGTTLSTNYTYYTVVDGEKIEAKPTSNMALKLPKESKGWVILPLPASGTWAFNHVEGAPYYGTTEDIAEIYLEFYEYNNASMLIDQIGFTGDAETFAAAAMDGNKYIPGFVDICKGNHSWVAETCGKDQFCSVCGEIGAKKATGKHTWVAANCGYPKTCSVCKATEGTTVGEHQLVAATCGTAEYCKVCAKTFNPATGLHTWVNASCEDPKTCSTCGAVEGKALGHNWVNGFCERCGMEEGDYTVVLDFDKRLPTAISVPKCTYIMENIGYKGNALILDRGTSAGLNSSIINFTATGLAGEEALVFYMDSSHNTVDGAITLYAYGSFTKEYVDAEGNKKTSGCLKPTAGKTVYFIDADTNKKTEFTIPESNGVPFTAGTEGWYVIPFSALTHDHWNTKIDTKTGVIVGDIVYNTLASGTVNGLFLGYGGAPGSFFELDNIGFTDDAAGFVAEAEANKVNSDVFGEKDVPSNVGGPAPEFGGGDDEEYVPDLSNPSPSDYNITVDFDEYLPVELKEHDNEAGNAGFSKITDAKSSYSGNGLWWDRGTDGNTTYVDMKVNPTGYSDENTFVFWIDTSDMIGTGHPLTVLLYGENAEDGSQVCMTVKNGGVYRLVNLKTNKTQDRVATADGSLYLPSGFKGFVMVPFAAMTSHWGGQGIKLKPGTVNAIRFQHGYTYGEQLYLDNIGFTHNLENFAEKAFAGTLNKENVRVDVGPHKLPLPEGVDVSDTNLGGGMDGKISDNEFFHTVANFNTKVPVVTNTNAYVKLAKEGLSGYGSGLNWFKVDDTLATDLNLKTEGGYETDKGIALWISTKNSGNSFDTKIRFMPHDYKQMKDGTMKERCWRLIDNATYYLVNNGVASSELVTNSQQVILPGGFEGWLIVPFESLEIHWGTPEGENAADQKIDPTQVKLLNLYYGNQLITEYLQIDEYGFYSHARKFIESIGAAFPVPPVTGLVIQSLDRTLGEGGIGTAAGNGILTWSPSAKLELTGDLSNDSYSVIVNAATGDVVHFPLDKALNEDDPYGVQAEDIPKMKDFTGLGFWITTEDAAADLTVSILLNNGKTVKITPTGKTTDIYRLVDENTALTTAHPFGKSDTIHVPANFTGWVVVDTNVFDGTGWDLSMLSEVIVTFQNDTVAYLDTIRTAKSAVSLIANEMSYPMDTDLLVSTDESKVTITTNSDGVQVVTLAENMSSAEFRDIVVVRDGYRAIYDDEKGAQVFGALDEMSIVAGIKVYLSDLIKAEYEVVVLGVEEEIENGYDIDGDGLIDGIGVDIDGDGIFDGIGWDPDGDGIFNGVWMDIDGDGIVDGLDLDFDMILDALDLNGDWHCDGIDMDGDGVIDGMGIDLDFDGIYDGVIDGIDVDGDDIWDGVDIDYDGVVDYYDIDGDAICDGIGIDMGGDGAINFVIMGVDFDGDGLWDGVDIDGDGYSDGIALDLDADGLYDGVGVDLTGDGYVDAMAVDLDGDGLFDGVDVNFDGGVDFDVIDGDLSNIPGLTFPGAGGDIPGMGDTTNLWVYILSAAMLCAVVALGYLNRKATNK